MNKITFINENWFWPIVIGAIMLLGIFIWKELAVRGRRRFILRLMLSIFAIGTLALIALEPALPSSETGGKLVLLTPGHEKPQLDSLKKMYPQLKVLEYSPKQTIPDDINEAEVVYILGHGLRDYDFGHLKHIPAIHLPGRSPEGIIKVRFPQKIAIGEELNLNALYRNPHSGHRITLEGPGGTGLDSVDLNNEDEQRFQLATPLKAKGNFVYYLTEKNPQGEVLSRDPIPVQVTEKESLRILILNNFPTFETKYLKNFLAEAGHELVVRSQITLGRFKYEYFNTTRTVIGSLSRENLESYDLLIIDAPSLRSLAGSQLGAIENAVRVDGLGVFVQPDEAFFISPGSFVNLKFERRRNNALKLEEWPEVELSVFPYAFISSPGQESIIGTGNSEIAGYNRIEQGRIGSTILANTWQLVLEGNSEIYRQIWSRMVGQLSKRSDLPTQFQQQEQFAFPHQPYNFKIRSEMGKPAITNREGRTIPIVQDANFTEKWKGTLWPRERGWNSLQQDTTAVFNYYVSEDGSWKSLIAQNTLDNNQRYFIRQIETGHRPIPVEPINPLWFYGIFLICMGGLWLEPKLS